jgi:hypothetical protein
MIRDLLKTIIENSEKLLLTPQQLCKNLNPKVPTPLGCWEIYGIPQIKMNRKIFSHALIREENQLIRDGWRKNMCDRFDEHMEIEKIKYLSGLRSDYIKAVKHLSREELIELLLDEEWHFNKKDHF